MSEEHLATFSWEFVSTQLVYKSFQRHLHSQQLFSFSFQNFFVCSNLSSNLSPLLTELTFQSERPITFNTVFIGLNYKEILSNERDKLLVLRDVLLLHRCTVVGNWRGGGRGVLAEFFWRGYLWLSENLGRSPFFVFFKAFLYDNFLDPTPSAPPPPPPVCIYVISWHSHN